MLHNSPVTSYLEQLFQRSSSFHVRGSHTSTLRSTPAAPALLCKDCRVAQGCRVWSYARSMQSCSTTSELTQRMHVYDGPPTQVSTAPFGAPTKALHAGGKLQPNRARPPIRGWLPSSEAARQ